MAGGEQEVKRSFSIIPCFVFVELVIMAGTVLLAYHFEYTNTFPIHVQGFFCYDSAYSKPYPGPEDLSRAPPALVYSLVTAIPTVMILIGELSSFLFQSGRSHEKTIITGECCYFSPLLRRIVRFLGVYSFGLFATTIFANAGQVVTGNQTPHFLTVCRPNYTALGCQSSSHYITEMKACTGVPALVTAARKAFPSKDSALSAYAAVYTVMYVTLVYKIKGSRLAKPSVCLTLLCPAFLVGVVHVAEYRNHWSDVLAGFLTGGAIAAFLVACVVNNFKTSQPPQKKALVKEKVNVPVMPLPCLESPLEKLSDAQIFFLAYPSHNESLYQRILCQIIELRSQISPDPRLCMFPTTPDVLIPSRSITSEV